MATIYIVRHGMTEGNSKGLFQGHTDTPLNEIGLRQADFLGERFREIELDAVYSSPLTRTKQTAKGICKYKDTPILDCKELIEIYGGDLEGMGFEEIMANYEEHMKNMVKRPSLFCPPGGESMAQVYERMSKAIDTIAAEHMGGTVAVVSHGCAIQNYMHYTTGKPFDEMSGYVVSNASVTKVVYGESGMIAEFWGDEEHIPPEFRSVPHRRPRD